jgi:hypothetical protein
MYIVCSSTTPKGPQQLEGKIKARERKVVGVMIKRLVIMLKGKRMKRRR